MWRSGASRLWVLFEALLFLGTREMMRGTGAERTGAAHMDSEPFVIDWQRTKRAAGERIQLWTMKLDCMGSNSTLPLTSQMTLGWICNIFIPQFPQLHRGGENSTCLIGFSRGLNKTILDSILAQGKLSNHINYCCTVLLLWIWISNKVNIFALSTYSGQIWMSLLKTQRWIYLYTPNIYPQRHYLAHWKIFTHFLKALFTSFLYIK